MTSPVPDHCRPEAHRMFGAAVEELESSRGLLHAAVAIARHEHSDADAVEANRILQHMADTVRSRLAGDSEVALIAHAHDLMFDELGFCGNADNYYDPANSYVPSVLETKTGLPITLCLIYKVVLDKLGLRVDGINAPGHFIVRVQGRGAPMIVDPFAQGRVLSGADVRGLITRALGREPESSEEMLPVATHRDWIARMLRNLYSVFTERGRPEDAQAMVELAQLLGD